MTEPHDPYRPSGDEGWSQPSYGQSQNPQPGEYGPPQQPQQPQYGQPQYGQGQYDGQYGQPQQPQYGQPQQPQYGENDQYSQGQYGQPGYPNAPVPPTRSRGRTRGIIAAAAAVVVIGGGVATYVAVSASSGGSGADTPQAAVQTMVSDVNNSDLIGVLDDLAPGERDAIAKPFQEQFDQLKRNGVISSSADASHLDGVETSATDLKFDSKTVTINDHVQIVQLTAGTIDVSADAQKLPFTKDFLDTIMNNGGGGPTSVHKTIDIAKVVSDTGKPIRIATQKVDGHWYPSMFYTIADYAAANAHLQAPSSADAIPASGASSADDAVKSVIEDLVGGKIEQAIELTSPDELAVLHDYGPLIVDKATYSPAPFSIDNISFTDTSISGGTRVSLKSLALTPTDSGAGQFQLSISGSCVKISVQGHVQNYCAANAIAQIEQGRQLSDDQQQALKDLFSALPKIGIDTSQTGGEWYVNPVRSYFDLSGVILSGLEDGDLTALLGLVSN